MTLPKEKAKELVGKMYQFQWRKDTIEFRNAKQCALIAVDEIINDNPNIYDSDRLNYKYWQEVKQEIEKIQN